MAEENTTLLLMEDRAPMVRAVVGALRPAEDRATSALQKSEERFRRTSALISDVIYSCESGAGESYAIDWMVGKVEAISGYTVEEIMARRCWRFLVWDEDRPLFEDHVVGVAPGEQGTCELRLRRKDGGTVWVASRVECAEVPGKAGHTVLYGILIDITERRRAEAILQQSEEKYRRLFETMAQGVVYQDVHGVILSANPAAERILGMSLERLRGKTSWDPGWKAFREDGTELPGADHPAMVSLRTGQFCGPIVMGIASPGRSVRTWLSVCAVPLFRPGEGVPFQVYTTFDDISDRKRAEDAVRGLVREKDLLLAEIHHRVKNNMGAMASLLSLQAGRVATPEAVSALLDAESRVRSMLVLYDKLHQKGAYGEILLGDYLEALAREIVGLFPCGRSVRLETHIEPLAVTVKTAFPLGIIVNELLTNTMKHAFRGLPGRVDLVVSRWGEGLSVVLQDDGAGIPEDVDLERSPGFGLRVVRLLVGQIGGTLRIERGQGTRFVLECPGV